MIILNGSFVKIGTVKFLNFRTPKMFAVSYLKLKTKRPNLRLFCQKVFKSYAELVTAKMIMSRNGSVQKMSSHRQTTSDTFGPQRR